MTKNEEQLYLIAFNEALTKHLPSPGIFRQEVRYSNEYLEKASKSAAWIAAKVVIGFRW